MTGDSQIEINDENYHFNNGVVAIVVASAIEDTNAKLSFEPGNDCNMNFSPRAPYEEYLSENQPIYYFSGGCNNLEVFTKDNAILDLKTPFKIDNYDVNQTI